MRDYTEFQLFVLTYLYAKDLEQISIGRTFGYVEMNMEDFATVIPAEILPGNAGYMSHQIYRLLIDHLLDSSDWEEYGVKRFRLNRFDGVIFVRRYLSTLIPELQGQTESIRRKGEINEKLIYKTEGKVEVKSYFSGLFNKLKERSQEEVVDGLISGAKQYGPAAIIFLIKMVQGQVQ